MVGRGSKLLLVSEGVEEPTVNLTPLIDVVFVILIMFIVIAPFLELEHVSLAEAAPHSSSTPLTVQGSSAIAIHVHSDNTIRLNQQVVSIAQLSDQLKILRQQHPAVHPQLFHDKSAHFGTYQAVKNALEAAGFSQLDLILQPN
jgi:biopolymer transport protein ExbD